MKHSGWEWWWWKYKKAVLNGGEVVGLDSGLLQTTNLCCLLLPGKPVALFCTILHRHIIPNNAPSLSMREIKYLFLVVFLLGDMWKKIFEKIAFLIWSLTSTCTAWFYDIYRCKRNDDILRIELLSDYKSEISRSCKFKEHLKKRQSAFYMDSQIWLSLFVLWRANQLSGH